MVVDKSVLIRFIGARRYPGQLFLEEHDRRMNGFFNLDISRVS
jgi:hypothetical protein